MKLYLSRRANGLYQLTGLLPIVTEMAGTDKQDVYPQPGDPVVFSGLCPFAVHRVFDCELAVLEITRVRIAAKRLTEVHHANGQQPG